MDYCIKIGGEAGQGVQTVGELLASAFSKMGYHVFTHQDYESRVRGGHNFYQIRVAAERVMSSTERVDIIVALDKASIDLHGPELREGGMLAYDAAAVKQTFDNPAFIDIPFRKIATDHGGAVYANTAATGAVFGMLGMKTEVLETLLRERFHKKGDPVVEANINSARAGFDYAKDNCRKCKFVAAATNASEKMLITTPEALAIGALASGLKFYAAYPMTPSTDIMNNIASRALKCGAIVEQAEDEIAAINMAIGASFAGVRAATGSSGGGFALMQEGVSLAAMTETPIVIFDAQRPAPATGLPTRTEQADLFYIIHAGHGEFPRVVFAPGSPRQALHLTNKAFDISEKFQIPAFVLIDQYIGDAQWTYDEPFDPAKLVYHDYRLRSHDLEGVKEYKRYAFRDSGVSPMAVPGDCGGHLVVADSDEHDEEGHIIEDAQTRIRMVQKRLHNKLGAIKNSISPPLHYGKKTAEVLLCGWGSTYGVLKEAVDALNKRGRKAAMLHFSEVYPLPNSNYVDILKRAKTSVCVEGNATGQFARLVKAETGFEFKRLITRYDGRPFSVDYILREFD